MPLNLTIGKSQGADRVRLSPAPLQAVFSSEQANNGRFELKVTASPDFAQRPGSNKNVTFRFADQESRNLFDQPPAEPFVLGPGQTLSLRFKNSLGISRRPADGPAAQQFARTGAGNVDDRFTRVVNLEFVDPAKADDPDDSDVHVEC